ncbi:MAG: PPOX class F420-dependent oxidoreductase [Acidimicrobiia bacterium]
MELTDALSFAAARRNGVLVTEKSNGRPQLSNIVYAVSDAVVRISITADRAKYRNLLRNPEASLHVSREDFWGYVVLEGDAELTPVAADPSDPTVDELVALYRVIGGEHPDWDEYRRAMVADRRLVLRLRPTYAYGLLGS